LRSAAAIGLAALVVAAGCGGGSLSSAQRARLEGGIADAHKAAAAHDAGGVRQALASFRASVRSARDAGAVSQGDADRLIAQALTASRRVGAEITPVPTAAPTAAPTATPAPTLAPAKKPPGKAKKDKPGKGHGHEGR
jgi:hypothetical protein